MGTAFHSSQVVLGWSQLGQASLGAALDAAGPGAGQPEAAVPAAIIALLGLPGGGHGSHEDQPQPSHFLPRDLTLLLHTAPFVSFPSARCSPRPGALRHLEGPEYVHSHTHMHTYKGWWTTAWWLVKSLPLPGEFWAWHTGGWVRGGCGLASSKWLPWELREPGLLQEVVVWMVGVRWTSSLGTWTGV